VPKILRSIVFGALLLCATALIGFTPSAPSKADNNPVETDTSVPVSYKTPKEGPTKQQLTSLRKRVSHNREVTWHWQDLALKPRTGTKYQEQWLKTPWKLERLRHIWWERRKHESKRAQNPPHERFWMCVHGREASWTDNASNNQHWGGLQMGEWFMRHYAPKIRSTLGRANNWPPLLQIWVAERAFEREGYSRAWLMGQWGQTAPYCTSLL
jgi:hypothetical protein